jgi:hypothetical protein
MLFPMLQVQDVDLQPASGRCTDLEKLACLVTTMSMTICGGCSVDRCLFQRMRKGEGAASITFTRAPIREKNRSKLLPTAFSFLKTA